MNTKARQLSALARQRRGARWSGYGSLHDYHSGVYDCDFVSPYTKSAGNVDSPVFIMLQDWVSHDGLARPVNETVLRRGRWPELATNRNLDRLLRAHLEMEIHDTYATNLFPFIKRGAMNAKIPHPDLVRAATEYGLPQIEIVCPRLVIALGLACFNALKQPIGEARSPTLAAAVQMPVTYRSTMIWCQAHTGWGGRNRGGAAIVEQDWRMMSVWLRAGSR